MDSRHHIIWIDLETGGLDHKVHQITQIAAVATCGLPELKEVASFEVKIELYPEMFSDVALEVQNYSDVAWAFQAVSARAALSELVKWLTPFTHQRKSKRTGAAYSAAHIAGYNVAFDGDFLRSSAERYNVWLPLTNWTGGVFDVLQYVKWWYFDACKPEPDSFKLADVCALWGIHFDAHDAMNDVRATLELATRLLREEE